MPRKPLPPAAPADVQLNHEALQSANQAATELVLLNEDAERRVRAVAQAVGYLLPADATNPDLIQRDIAANMRRSVEAVLEVGRGLTVLKAACEHGTFLPRLEALGLEAGVAQRFMQAAAKFSNAATSRLLSAAGNQSKLFELLVLDDEQIEELELMGQTGELALDDVATMSVKELRAALRETREAAAAKDQVIAKQSEKIDAQAEQLARPYKARKGELAQNAEDAATLAELTDALLATEQHFARLAGVVAELQGHRREPMRARGLDAVRYIAATVAELIGAHDLDIDLSTAAADGRPSWLDLDKITAAGD